MLIEAVTTAVRVVVGADPDAEADIEPLPDADVEAEADELGRTALAKIWAEE